MCEIESEIPRIYMRCTAFIFIIHLNIDTMEAVRFQVILIGALVLFDVSRIVIESWQRNSNHVDLFPLSIIHINDFHAKYIYKTFWNFWSLNISPCIHYISYTLLFRRFEETNERSSRCQPTEKCIGGYARAVTVIKELQRMRANPIYLNAGDNYQGSLWYTLGGWNVTSYALNLLNADAVVSKTNTTGIFYSKNWCFQSHFIWSCVLTDIGQSWIWSWNCKCCSVHGNVECANCRCEHWRQRWTNVSREIPKINYHW